jgi:hypothetical protein
MKNRCQSLPFKFQPSPATARHDALEAALNRVGVGRMDGAGGGLGSLLRDREAGLCKLNPAAFCPRAFESPRVHFRAAAHSLKAPGFNP